MSRIELQSGKRRSAEGWAAGSWGPAIHEQKAQRRMSLELRAGLSHKAASGVVLKTPGLSLYMSKKPNGRKQNSYNLINNAIMEGRYTVRITHLCFGGPFTDGFSYQDNLLPKYHKKLGYDVTIITSNQSFDGNGKIISVKAPNTYENENGIIVNRLPYKKPFKFYGRFRRFIGTYEAIEMSRPDILFIHGCQFLDIDKVVNYLKRHPGVVVYVDNHADFSNSARNFISYHFIHKLIWNHCAHEILPFVKRFYGVLPARVDFLKQMYHIPASKISLLVMGADDDRIKKSISLDNVKQMRERLGIKEDEFLIMTGGKIDLPKRQTLYLMEAVNHLANPKIKLVVFGSVVPELKTKVEALESPYTHYIGWVDSKDTSDYFAAADLIVFPGRHSVFWEQAAGLGKPMICKYWAGTTHIDVGGNVLFLKKDSAIEIEDMIRDICNHPTKYQKMKDIAQQVAMKEFSYMEIARKSLN